MHDIAVKERPILFRDEIAQYAADLREGGPDPMGQTTIEWCDLCVDHAVRVGPYRDHCPAHAKAKAAGDAMSIRRLFE